MAVVLDGYVVVGLANNYPAATNAVGVTIESGHCYITISSVIEAACFITQDAGARLAEKWIGWLYTNDRVTILERSHRGWDYIDEKFVLLVSEAYSVSGLTPAAASAAAAARWMNIPVLTDREKFKYLEEIGFCQVRWIG